MKHQEQIEEREEKIDYLKEQIELSREEYLDNTEHLKNINDTIEANLLELKRRAAKLNYINMSDDDFINECEDLKDMIKILKEANL